MSTNTFTAYTCVHYNTCNSPPEGLAAMIFVTPYVASLKGSLTVKLAVAVSDRFTFGWNSTTNKTMDSLALLPVIVLAVIL